MADLDEQTGHALCRSLERVLTRELGQPVTCRNVADSSLRWDIEASDGAGIVVRRISHTQTVPERMAMAGAELRDIRESADAALAQLGVTGVGASIHGRSLPQTRRRRQELGRELARRIARYQETGQPVTEDPMAMILSGRHPHEDPVAAALAHVTVLPTRPDSPARIRASGDDRLGYRVPDLHEEVLPAIATKQRRHGSLASELTLVVEPVLSRVSTTAIRELRSRLGEEHQGFKSVYAGRVQADRFPLRRIY